MKATIAFAAALLASAIAVPAAFAADKTVVLVHGAWADGSSWSKVVPYLQQAGLNVVAVQNPLASLEGDAANVTRVIEDQAGPIVLVGHSYGGMVITEAGNNDKVKALVYVAAFAPEPNQSVNAILSAFPAPEWLALLHADAGGYVTWPADAMEKYFSAGVSHEEALVLAATQHPTFYGVNDNAIGAKVAYADKPTWSVVSEDDQIIPAPLQMHFAEVMESTVVPVKTGHLPMLIDPEAVAKVIITAAEAVE